MYRLKILDLSLPAGAHIIKAETAQDLAAATRLIEEAEKKAAEIVARAQRHYREEKQRGYREGLARAAAESVDRLLREQALLEANIREITTDLADLVADCVRRLIGEMADRKAALSHIRNGLRRMRKEKRITLKVPSEHHAFLRDEIEALKTEFPEIEIIDVVEDASLSGLQFRMESAIGRIDGDCERNFQALAEELRSGLSAYVARLRQPQQERPKYGAKAEGGGEVSDG